MLLRVRVTSFLVGVGVASTLGLYQLRTDVINSHAVIIAQADEYKGTLEARVASLENAVAQLKKD